MRIGLDARMLGNLGIGTYVAGLLGALPHVLSGDDRLVVFASPAGHDRALSLVGGRSKVDLRITPGSPRQLRDQVELAWQFHTARLDLLHVPHYNEPFASFERTVATIHDLIPLLYPDLFSIPRRALVRLQITRTVRRARALIAPSIHTSLDLQHALGVPPSRITVIPEAADGRWQSPSSGGAPAEWMRRHEVRQPFLFYSGQWTPYKNVHVLLEAFARLLPHYPTLLLVIGGKADPRQHALQRQIRALGDRVRPVGWIPDEVVASVMHEAAALVFASEYEGFGLPVLEAMAQGVPVVCARASSLPEVAGDGAEYWEPRSGPAGLADAVEHALEPARAEQLRSAGRAQARRFSWSATAQQTVALYRRVLGQAGLP